MYFFKAKSAKSETDINDNYYHYHHDVKKTEAASRSSPDSAEISRAIDIPSSTESSPKNLAQKQNYFDGEASQEASEIMHHTMEGLRVLKEEQDDLDLWYKMEQVKLAERYDRMRLMNIQKQKSIIESSHDLLLTTSIDTTPLRQSHVQPSTSMLSDAAGGGNRMNTNNASSRMQSVISHNSSKDLGEVNNSSDKSSPSPYRQGDDKLVQSQVVSANENVSNSSSSLKNENFSKPIQHSSKRLTFEEPVFERKPDSCELVKAKCETKTSITPDIPTSRSSQFDSNKLSCATKETIGSEFVMRFHQSMDAKLRRKSRATKFFPTPEKKPLLKSKLNDYKIEASPGVGECYSDSPLSKSCGDASVFGTPTTASVEAHNVHNMECLLSSLDKQKIGDVNMNNDLNSGSFKINSRQTSQFKDSNTMVTPLQSLTEAGSSVDSAGNSPATLDAANTNYKMMVRKSLDSVKQNYDVSSINNVMKQIADSPGFPKSDGLLQQNDDEKVRNSAASGITCMTPTARGVHPSDEKDRYPAPLPQCLAEGMACMTPTAAGGAVRPTDFISTTDEKDNATSTPHDAMNGGTPYLERFHQNLSLICGAEMPMVDYCNEVRSTIFTLL